ncbi:hypothetical protein ACFSTD_10035 [Novosphingobium colocasiae]
MFASTLFALAAIAALATIIRAWTASGREALALRHQLAGCSGELTVEWAVVERIGAAPLASLRAVSARRLPEGRRHMDRPMLAWPQPSCAA